MRALFIASSPHLEPSGHVASSHWSELASAQVPRPESLGLPGLPVSTYTQCLSAVHGAICSIMSHLCTHTHSYHTHSTLYCDLHSLCSHTVCVCVWVGVGVGHAHLPSPDLAHGTGRLGGAKARPHSRDLHRHPSGLTKGRLECGDLWSAVLPFGPNHDGPHLWLSARGRVSSTGFQPGRPFHQQALWPIYSKSKSKSD